MDTERFKPSLEAGANAGLDFPGEHWSLVSEVRQLTVEKDVGSVRHETPRNTLGLGRQSGKAPTGLLPPPTPSTSRQQDPILYFY